MVSAARILLFFMLPSGTGSFRDSESGAGGGEIAGGGEGAEVMGNCYPLRRKTVDEGAQSHASGGASTYAPHKCCLGVEDC